jgi:hypothetical protein
MQGMRNEIKVNYCSRGSSENWKLAINPSPVIYQSRTTDAVFQTDLFNVNKGG